MINIIVQQYLFLVLSVIFIFSIGRGFLSLYPIIINSFFRIFLSMIIGFSLIIVIYSIIKAQGKTINLLVLPIGGYLIFHFKYLFKKNRINLSGIIADYAIAILFTSLLFFYQLYFYVDIHSLIFKPISRDYFFYASVCDSLKLYGTENFFPAMNHFFPGILGLMPYHYPELWLNALFSQLFNCATTNSYFLIVSPILNGTLLIGISSLFEKKINNIFLLLIISFILLGVSGLFFPVYYNLGFLYESWWHSIVSIIGYSGTKFSFSYIFILLATILFSKKNHYIGFIVLTLSPIFSVGMLPGIWGGTILFLFCNYFLKLVELTKKETQIIISLTVVEIILFYLFYRFFGESYTNKYASNQIYSIFTQSNGNIFLTLKQFGGNIINYYIKIALFYIPYFVPLLLINKWNKANWFFASIMLFCAAVTTTITHSLTDSTQFTSNIGVFIVCIIIVDFATVFTSLNKRSSFLTFLMIICLSSLFLFSALNAVEGKTSYFIEEGNPTFVNRVSKIVSKDPAPILVFYNKEYYQNTISIRSACSVFDKDLIKIHQLNNIPLITPSGNIEFYKKYNYMNYADSFYYSQFSPVIVWKQIDSTHTLESFIEHFHLKYFYFMNGVQVPQFINKIQSKIIISESSQSKFIYRTEQ